MHHLYEKVQNLQRITTIYGQVCYIPWNLNNIVKRHFNFYSCYVPHDKFYIVRQTCFSKFYFVFVISSSHVLSCENQESIWIFQAASSTVNHWSEYDPNLLYGMEIKQNMTTAAPGCEFSKSKVGNKSEDFFLRFKKNIAN